MSASPRDLILQGTWHHALFTTYSLSLSFFESHLWCGGLKKRGCREAWVIADLDGYSASLAERQSRFVGHDYRLIPVALKHGVFHPKCSFLSGPDGALLLVGSGNLTFGGHGRNIEVLEVFRSAEHPSIFAEFAGFLAALRERKDLLNPDPAWIPHFEELARRAAGGTPPPLNSSLRLLHSTQESILDQLATAAAPLGFPSEARILSPFFDNHAEAVASLTNRLQPARLRIALPPHEKEKSSFPFTHPPGGIRAEAAKVTVEKPSRKLHAKWIELDFASGDRLTLTGSVNATRQALCSTNNIEVGILRSDSNPAASPLQWVQAATPAEVENHDFEKAGLGSRALLHARVSEDGNLRGCVLGPHGASTLWQATLDLPNGSTHAFEVTTDSTGAFTHRLPSSQAIDDCPGLQLRLSQAEVRAQCWVQNDSIIEMADLGVRFAGNFLRGEASEDDEISFLTSLHESIAELAPALAAHHASRATSTSEGAKQPKPELVVPLSSLAPIEEGDEVFSETAYVSGASSRSQKLAKVLDRVFRNFQEQPARVISSRRPGEEDDDSLSEEEAVAKAQEEEENSPPRSEKHDSKLKEFHNHMLAYVGKEGALPAKRAAFFIWFHTELREHLRGSPADLQPALTFLREWFLLATRHLRLSAMDVPADACVWLAACILGLQTKPDELPELAEALERYLPETEPPELWAEAPAVPPSYLRLVPPGADLLAGARSIRSIRTFRQEVSILKACAETVPPRSPPSDLKLFKSADGKELKRRLLSSLKVVPIHELRLGRRACPNPRCNFVIPSALFETLRLQRVVICANCEGVVIDLTSRA